MLTARPTLKHRAICLFNKPAFKRVFTSGDFLYAMIAFFVFDSPGDINLAKVVLRKNQTLEQASVVDLFWVDSNRLIVNIEK